MVGMVLESAIQYKYLLDWSAAKKILIVCLWYNFKIIVLMKEDLSRVNQCDQMARSFLNIWPLQPWKFVHYLS